jgi:hypothetical protein
MNREPAGTDRRLEVTTHWMAHRLIDHLLRLSAGHDLLEVLLLLLFSRLELAAVVFLHSPLSLFLRGLATVHLAFIEIN